MLICDNFHQAVGYCSKLISADGDDDAQLIPYQLGGHLLICFNCWVDLHYWNKGGSRLDYDAEGRVRIVTRLPDA